MFMCCDIEDLKELKRNGFASEKNTKFYSHAYSISKENALKKQSELYFYWVGNRFKSRD